MTYTVICIKSAAITIGKCCVSRALSLIRKVGRLRFDVAIGPPYK